MIVRGKLLVPQDALISCVDYNWRNQRVDQASVNLERQIHRNVVLDVGYLHVRGRNNKFARNLNQALQDRTINIQNYRGPCIKNSTGWRILR